MATITKEVRYFGLGTTISASVPRESDGGDLRDISVPAGKVGQLTTRTDNETGTLTMDTGHGITTGAVIDLYWDGGARYGITVGTVSVDSVPIGADNSGTGSNLPTNLTDIVASVQVEFTCAIDGDALQLLVMQLDGDASGVGRVGFLIDTSPEFDHAFVGIDPKVVDVVAGDTSTHSGVVNNGVATNGSSTTDATLRIRSIEDATP